MTSDQQTDRVNHGGTQYCTECGTDLRVGRVDHELGLFCGCTLANGHPFKPIGYGIHPWPDEWELEEND